MDKEMEERLLEAQVDQNKFYHRVFWSGFVRGKPMLEAARMFVEMKTRLLGDNIVLIQDLDDARIVGTGHMSIRSRINEDWAKMILELPTIMAGSEPLAVKPKTPYGPQRKGHGGKIRRW